MFKKILFPTKFEEYSLAILKSISCLKVAGLEEVVLLHVIDTDALYTEMAGGSAFNLDFLGQAAMKRLDSYSEYLQSEGITATTEVSEGSLVSQIIEKATEANVSLIVAGRQKRGLLGELFIGSNTDRVIRKARVPVLVAKYHTIKETEGQVYDNFCTNMFRQILYPTDWSTWAQSAKEYLPSLRQVGASEIVIVHIVEDLVIEPEYMTYKTRELIEDYENKLESLKNELQAEGFEAKAYLIKGGRAYQQINKIATDEDVSMIVLGSHGKGFVEETLWGSVSQRVVEYSEKPVLVVK
jgi:nucleotide-binding universal stress UspA family protein